MNPAVGEWERGRRRGKPVEVFHACTVEASYGEFKKNDAAKSRGTERGRVMVSTEQGKITLTRLLKIGIKGAIFLGE